MKTRVRSYVYIRMHVLEKENKNNRASIRTVQLPLGYNFDLSHDVLL
jgi:hypothetical protein